MNFSGRKRLLILISALTALALTSTAMGQVVINNNYSLHVSPITPDVNLTKGNQTFSGLNTYTNAYGTVAHANLTEFFKYPSHQTSKNLSSIFLLSSTTSGNFYYTINVTSFTGYSHIEELSIYSITSTNNYIQNFKYTKSNGNATGNTPVIVNPGTNTSIGVYISVGSKDTGPYVWNLDLLVNGYFTGSNSSKVVFTQYYVDFLITTYEGA